MSLQKVIIDADPGIGDAVAIALALIDPELEVVALTSCGGLISGKQAFCNLQTIASIIDPPRWPRIGWSDALAGNFRESPAISGILKGHGHHGLGECEPITAPRHQPTDSSKLLADLVRAFPNELTLVTLGPLTNVSMAQERYSGFLSELKSLIVCGGSVASGGDATSTAEFNIFADPEAAQHILTSDANKTLLPIDISHQFGLSFDEYDQLGVDSFSRLGKLLDDTIPFALRAARNQLGKEGILLAEVVAIAAISHPELFEHSAMTVDVELTGDLTRGMTVFDRRGLPHWKQNIEVITNFEPLGVKDYMLRLIGAADVGS